MMTRIKRLAKCFEMLYKLGRLVWVPVKLVKPPPVISNYRPFQDGTSNVVLCVACFDVSWVLGNVFLMNIFFALKGS